MKMQWLCLCIVCMLGINVYSAVRGTDDIADSDVNVTSSSAISALELSIGRKLSEDERGAIVKAAHEARGQSTFSQVADHNGQTAGPVKSYLACVYGSGALPPPFNGISAKGIACYDLNQGSIYFGAGGAVSLLVRIGIAGGGGLMVVSHQSNEKVEGDYYCLAGAYSAGFGGSGYACAEEISEWGIMNGKKLVFAGIQAGAMAEGGGQYLKLIKF